MKTILPIDIIPLGEDNSYHLFVRGTVNGKKYDLLIDTGASHTVFDAALIPEASKEETQGQEIHSASIHSEELRSSLGYIRKFKLGDLKCRDWMVVLIDLNHVNELYRKYTSKHIAGLLGSDFLLQYKAVIDYKKRALTLRNIKHCPM